MEEAPSRSSNIIFDPLHQDSFATSIKTFIKVIGTCIGPRAKLKLLRHVEGGSVTLTSSSQRLFQLISVKNIFSKIIISAAKSQLKSFNDGGLSCVLLILRTIHHTLSSEYPLPIIGTIYEYYGGSANASLASKISYGTISNFEILHVEGKTFLLLHNEEIPVVSLVLGHYNAEASAELQIVCRQAISVLFQILQSGRVCLGGGCSEAYTAHLWASKVKNQWDTIQSETGCTLGHLQETYSTFLKSLTDICVAIHQGTRLDFVTENVHGHLWKLKDGQFPSGEDRCACGINAASDIDSWSFLSDMDKSPLKFETKPVKDSKYSEFLLLDELSCKANAFSLAFETASLLLRTSVCVNNLQ